MLKKVFVYIICYSCLNFLQAQTTSLANLPTKTINALTKKYQQLTQKINKQTENYIASLEKQEKKLQKQLATKDSIKAKEQLANMQEHYKKLKDRLKKADTDLKPTNEYLPQLDSISTAALFLQKNNINSAALKELNTSLMQLQSKLQAGAEIKRLMKSRKDMLRQQLKDAGVTKQLDALSKETYYYKQQINEFKALLKDKDKAKQKLLAFVKEDNSFKEFMKKNGFLGKLFGEMGAANGASNMSAGLPTRNQIMSELSARYGANNPLANGNMGGGNFLDDQIKKAKKDFNKIKDKVKGEGTELSDADMPNFKPNTQRGKSFIKRLEFGMNVQSAKQNNILPTTTDIAITMGYKLNDKSVIGIGAAYKLGWGNGWQDIRLTNQGLGIRTFTDIKLFPKAKEQGLGRMVKNIWISGGFEWNYLPELAGKTKAGDINWQEAGLLGLSKKYSKGKKKVHVQLLYNFLYNKTNPQQTPVLCRVGWGL